MLFSISVQHLSFILFLKIKKKVQICVEYEADMGRLVNILAMIGYVCFEKSLKNLDFFLSIVQPIRRPSLGKL